MNLKIKNLVLGVVLMASLAGCTPAELAFNLGTAIVDPNTYKVNQNERVESTKH